MSHGRDSPGLDPSAAGRLLRALSVEPPVAPESASAPGDGGPSASWADGTAAKPDGAGGYSTPTEEPPPHSPIPGYTVDRLLGEGGGGIVYRAFRQGSDRPLALKVLKARAGDRAAKRAWRELEILEHLRLPCLPRLIDYGDHGGRLYFATEFIDGLHLDKYCEGGTALQSGVPGGTALPSGVPIGPGTPHPSGRALPLRARVELLARVADAVQSLHEHGIIHRDLKPSNIIVAEDGQPMLVDFGLAALIEGGEQPQWTLTEEGAPVGTPAFMAPEQARGERSRISTRTDVYGLGATAYFILTGSTPHDTNTSIHEAVRRVAQDESRDPRSLSPVLPRPLAAVLRKACEQDPQRRYASAAALAADLQRWTKGQPVEAGHPSPWTRATRWASRHPVLTTALFCLLVGILSLVATQVGIWWLNQEPYRFVFTLDEEDVPRSANLVSRSGRILETLEGGNDYQMPIATLIDFPREFRSSRYSRRQIAVVSAEGANAAYTTGDELWFCDPRDLRNPTVPDRTENQLPAAPARVLTCRRRLPPPGLPGHARPAGRCLPRR